MIPQDLGEVVARGADQELDVLFLAVDGIFFASNITKIADTPEGRAADTQCFAYDHLRRMTEEVAMGAMKVCGAHAYVREA